MAAAGWLYMLASSNHWQNQVFFGGLIIVGGVMAGLLFERGGYGGTPGQHAVIRGSGAFAGAIIMASIGPQDYGVVGEIVAVGAVVASALRAAASDGCIRGDPAAGNSQAVAGARVLDGVRGRREGGKRSEVKPGRHVHCQTVSMPGEERAVHSFASVKARGATGSSQRSDQ